MALESLDKKINGLDFKEAAQKKRSPVVTWAALFSAARAELSVTSNITEVSNTLKQPRNG